MGIFKTNKQGAKMKITETYNGEEFEIIIGKEYEFYGLGKDWGKAKLEEINSTDTLFPFKVSFLDCICWRKHIRPIQEPGQLVQEPEKLKLVVKDNCLTLRHKDGRIGFIQELTPALAIKPLARCHMVSSSSMYETYCQWRDAGMHVDHTPVEFMGGTYFIATNFNLKRKDITNGNIYDLATLNYYSCCEDRNIIRDKYNNKPLGF
jgi:hypothetical protein